MPAQLPNKNKDGSKGENKDESEDAAMDPDAGVSCNSASAAGGPP